MSRRTVIVGAGLGGLSAAVRLAVQGWDVTVLEASDGPGGKAGSREAGGYRFDTGPTLLTMPEVFDELFETAGEKREDSLRLLPLGGICSYFWPSGKRFTAWSDPGRFSEAMAESLGESAGDVTRYFRHAREVAELSVDLFLKKSLHEASTWLSVRALRSVLSAWKLDPFRTLHAAHASYFRTPEAIQLFDRYATYNGSDPYRCPGAFVIIPHVEHAGGGSYTALGGIRAVPLAIEALAKRRGVRFRYVEKATRIVNTGGRVKGVETAQGFYPADTVVSNADVAATYRDLLQDTKAPLYRRNRKMEGSLSGLVFYWGMKGGFPELGVNNIFFSHDYRAEFSDLFQGYRCPADPTVYVNITSKANPGDAPAGCENWFVLVNAPPDRGQDWAAESARVRAAVVDKISAALGRNIESFIETEAVMTPPDIRDRTSSDNGSLYGIASNTPFAAFLRHPNRSMRHRGLYLCGGSVHPGGGMPLAVLSGKIAAELVRKYEGRP